MRKLILSASMFALSVITMRALAAEPPAAAAAPPPGAGLDLINQRCGFCHSTGQVFSQKKTPADWDVTVHAMADRGAEVSPEEIRTIVDYLGKNYSAAATLPEHK